MALVGVSRCQASEDNVRDDARIQSFHRRLHRPPLDGCVYLEEFDV